MEVLKDYPKEFAKLFRPSFNYLLKINMKLLAKDEGFVRKYWRFLYIIPFLVMNYITLSWNLAKMVAIGEIFEVAYMLPPFLVCTQAIIKATILIPKRSLLTNIIEQLGSLWRTTGLSDVQKNARDSLLKRVNFCNGVSYWVSVIGSTQYVMTALVETLVRRLVWNQDYDLMLALQASYPFDATGNWAVYLAVYAFQAYSMLLSVSAYTSAEFMITALCALLGAEFTLLCEDMLLLLPAKKITGLEIANDEQDKLTLKDIIERHQKLCSLSEQLNEAFHQIIFIDLVFVGLTTCFFRYAAQFSRGPTYMINNNVAMLFPLLNALYLCYYGELLSGESLRLGEMAYHSLWYKGNKQYRKIIEIIIMRSQKPCCMTSMKYAPVTLNTFTKVISTTWSYLSLMNSVYGDK